MPYPGRPATQYPAPQYQGQPQGYGPGQVRPPYAVQPYPGANYARPAYRGYEGQGYAPVGHLQDWLNQHRNLPVQDQERLLRSDPSFNRQPPQVQQRLLQQLHQVDQMPEDVRQRRLARNEMLERLSPQEQMQVTVSSRRWGALPPDRQAMMRNAFRDLRSVPLDQRATVLNSARYQGVFSPEERGILSDMLRVEPYEAAR
jgi:hypothetical protein